MTDKSDVAGVLLAGGLSRRMGGGDKCLRDLGGRPILAHIIARAAPQVGKLVLNANGDPARFDAFGLPVAADVVEGYAGPLAGVLIRGPSGSGKSDLALRAIAACPWRRTRLVADDSALVGLDDAGRVLARCPAPIAGLIELRGVGITPMQRAAEVVLRAVVDLAREVDRMPEPGTVVLPGTGGVKLAALPIVPSELSAAEKLRYGMRSIVAGHSAPTGQDGAPD